MNILFLCTGNACRSQMAEGWAKHFINDRYSISERNFSLKKYVSLKNSAKPFAIESAGIEAHGKNPLAITVMGEVGIDISQQESTQLTTQMLRKADIVVTVCANADKHCPPLALDKQTKLNWPLSDPAKASGNEEAILREFRRTRDEIQGRVKRLLASLANDEQRFIDSDLVESDIVTRRVTE